MHDTAPFVRAVGEVVVTLKELVAEPVPPVAAVVAQYWTRTMTGVFGHMSLEEKLHE